MKRLQTFPNSCSIKIRLPVSLVVITGNDLPGSKNLDFIPEAIESGDEDSADLVELFKAINQFVKTSLKVIKIGTDGNLWGWNLQIIEQLSISKMTLREVVYASRRVGEIWFGILPSVAQILHP